MQFDQLNRRAFITLLGSSAIAWPLAVRAQQPAMPVQQASQGHGSPCFAGFREGLNEIGYVESRIAPSTLCAVLRPAIALLTSWTCRSQAGV